MLFHEISSICKMNTGIQHLHLPTFARKCAANNLPGLVCEHHLCK